jgi:predicted small metal-binding protein
MSSLNPGGDFKIMRTFTCKQSGMNCSFKAIGNTDNELARKIIDHMESDHNMQVIPPEHLMKVKNAIK